MRKYLVNRVYPGTLAKSMEELNLLSMDEI